jgi:hypothetical protein
MIRIRFPNDVSERRGLGYLAGRFSFKSLATGVTFVPDSALSALAQQGIPYMVEGLATYEEIIQAVRNPSAAVV